MNICFIGGGNMAVALIGGLLGKGYDASNISVVEINPDNRDRLQHDFGVRVTDDLAAGIEGSDVVVFAVKPQQLREVAQLAAPVLAGQLLVSIAAGIRAGDLARWAGSRNIVRAMPNTPALVQSGITGLYALPDVGSEQCLMAENILKAVGATMWLENEAMVDAITAISGSGPAYVFYFIESLQKAAVELGFNDAQARALAIDTFLGASKLASASGEDPAVLRARVTSKNGTTERALLSMAGNHVDAHIVQAAQAAAARAKEMADELGKA